MSDTPIFDAVVAEQGLEFPRPVPEDHAGFMERNGYPAFMLRAEKILRGKLKLPIEKKGK